MANRLSTPSRGLLCALGVVIALGCQREAPAAGRLVAEFVAEARAGRFDAAYARLAPSYRARVDLETFRSALEGNVYLVEARGFRVTQVTSGDGGATQVDGLLDSGGDIPVTALVIRERERLYLAELRAPAEPLLP